MEVNEFLQATDKGFDQKELDEWNKDPMICSVYHRVTDARESANGQLLNVDTLVHNLGRPNFERAVPTSSEEGVETNQPALLLLNGHFHKRFLANKYDQIMNTQKHEPFKSGRDEYLEVTQIKLGRLGLQPSTMMVRNLVKGKW